MDKVTSFKDLIVWQKARVLTKYIYIKCKMLPPDENFALSAQMRRCSVSIVSNIAEGYKRKGRAEYVNFISIANGSAGELEAQLILMSDLFGIETAKEQELTVEVQRMLTAMQIKLTSSK
jgi:four helix bundle protein